MPTSFEIFFSYANEDEKWLKKITKYLYTLQRQNYIQGWHDHNILAGGEWEHEIMARLNTAPIILLLISQDFIASDFCWGVQLQQVMQRHEAGTACVIPIIVRPTDWHDTPFAKLQFLPHDGQPLSTCSNEEEALLQVAQSIRRVVEQMRKSPLVTIASKTVERTNPPIAQQPWNVPLLRNPFFTGREDLLTRLRSSLVETHTMALSQPQAISGLGGIGKTQVALEYAYRYRHDYQAVLWVKASTQQELAEDVAALTRTLNLPEQRASKQQESIDAIKRWLTTHAGWLLIFDNADDLSPLAEYLPPEPKGHILLTTRAHAMSGMAQKIEVAQMDEAEGVHLLLHRAGLIDQQTSVENLPAQTYQQAAAIFHLLGGLPLALDQAGAYIEETHENLSSYINLYQTQRKDLLERRGGIRSDHVPVATTWTLALQTIEQSNPAAIELMRLCAFLAPDAIPEELILLGEEYLSPLLQTITEDRAHWNSTLADLLKYSLIRRNQETMFLSIHRLLQAVIKDEMNNQQQEAWETCVVRLVDYIFPFDEDADKDDDESDSNDEEDDEYEGVYQTQNQDYLPHALQAAGYIARRKMTFSEAIDLQDNVGSYLYDQGQYRQAEPLLVRALATHELISGSDHPDITEALNNLADLYEVQAKYEQAERLFQRSLTICEQALGPDHADTIVVLNSLAFLYKRLSKYEQAETLFQRVLAIREHEFGPDHPDTTTALINLAALYNDQHEFDRAKPLYKRSLMIRERVLGQDHPDTAEALMKFADLYRDDVRFSRAQRLYRRALAIQERVLGPEHLDVAHILDSLASVYTSRGKYEQAALLYQRVLAICEHALDPEHPYTALVVESLARLYADQRKYEQAEPLYLRSLTIREHVFGPNHPSTVRVRKAYQKLQRKKNRRSGGLFSFFFKKRE